MAFEVAYSLQSNVISPAKDIPLHGTSTPKKGELVKLVTGLAQKTATAGGTSDGVMVGKEFMGLVAQGQEYAAPNAALTNVNISNANGTGKVILDKNIVYRVPVYQGGAKDAPVAADRNSTFAINTVSGDQQVDLNVTTTPSVKVIDWTPDGKFVFVTLI